MPPSWNMRDGTMRETLVDLPESVEHPDVSPDGSRIAFRVTVDDKDQIWTADRDGSDPAALIPCDDPGCFGTDFPAWSPDGMSIAFTSYAAPVSDDLPPSGSTLSVMNLTTGPTRIVATSGPGEIYDNARWSPEAERLVFQIDQFDDTGAETALTVAVISVTGGEARRITDGTLFGGYPDWNPKDERIVFATYDLGAYAKLPRRGGIQSLHRERRRLPADSTHHLQTGWTPRHPTDVAPERQGDSADVRQHERRPIRRRPVSRRWRAGPPRRRRHSRAGGPWNMRHSLEAVAAVAAAAFLLAGCTATPLAGRPESSSPSPAKDSSADAPRLLFEWYRPDGPKALYLAAEDGRGAAIVTDDVAASAEHVHADWSPDGTRIAFEARGDDGVGSIWIADADGLHAVETISCASDGCLQEAFPSWSPDGKSMAFVQADGSGEIGGPVSVVVMDLASGVRRTLAATDGTAVYYGPRWSPDGTQLVAEYETFTDRTQNENLSSGVVLIPADGSSAPTALTPPELFAGHPDWSWTENLIVFGSSDLSVFDNSSSDSNLYTIRPDGTQLRQLTKTSLTGLKRMGLASWGAGRLSHRRDPCRPLVVRPVDPQRRDGVRRSCFRKSHQHGRPRDMAAPATEAGEIERPKPGCAARIRTTLRGSALIRPRHRRVALTVLVRDTAEGSSPPPAKLVTRVRRSPDHRVRGRGCRRGGHRRHHVGR